MMELLGNLLIAPPSVKNNFWHKTVIMITEDHSQGSIGVVLNKRSSISIAELGERLGLYINHPGVVYIGGPLCPKNISIIHSNEWITKNTLCINDYFSLSSSDDMLPRISAGDVPKQWRLFAGISIWDAGQLYNEIKGIKPYNHSTSWCIASGDTDLVYSYDGKEQWLKSLEKSGNEFTKNILK